jgi:hypothetical protein
MARAQVKVTRSEPVYKFDELSDSAKEKAREWFREASLHDEWWDSVYEDAVQCGKVLGIEIEHSTPTGRVPSPGSTGRPVIYFSGFWSQGDGACFEGSYSYPEFDTVERSPVKLIREHAPKDAELHRIADELEELQAKQAVLCPGTRITATMNHRGQYSHSGSMDVFFGMEAFSRDLGSLVRLGLDDDSIDQRLTRAMRDFADWIYRQLEKEHEWLNADAQVDESITANEYTFDEDGNTAGAIANGYYKPAQEG